MITHEVINDYQQEVNFVDYLDIFHLNNNRNQR